ncbi:phosphohistidine phosphatase SixA [Vibrio algarum]|uniref:Phosphohistidine phosphatase SixA n=1 Tax=Vibrio algarum TaxID=3020714 RepID=A0ABT4YP58_9VIBR|nr:phosphohistidine phosphatase SixA [Vibrio sp. KJ40-1]MDB1123339.1 phosphohistidine phosphatase SixA [Vibrio sp. KJ40-1]
MKVFIMRHGEAAHYAASDAERELTQHGRSQSTAVARACEKQGFKDFDLVLVSPYIRAQQTWETISELFCARELQTYDEITPYGDSEEASSYVSALAQVKHLDTVLLVSHLPLVGYLTAEFVTNLTPPMFPTSGLACVEFDPDSQKGELLWHIHP